MLKTLELNLNLNVKSVHSVVSYYVGISKSTVQKT